MILTENIKKLKLLLTEDEKTRQLLKLCNILMERESNKTDKNENLITAFVGPTGVGKSHLFNYLAESDISLSGYQRPSTTLPLALTKPENLNNLSNNFLKSYQKIILKDPKEDILKFKNNNSEIEEFKIFLSAQTNITWPWPKDLVLFDTPDFDSILSHNKEISDDLSLRADALIIVTDQAKYADQSFWEFLKKDILQEKPILIILNKVNNTEVIEDFKSLLALANRPKAELLIWEFEKKINIKYYKSNKHQQKTQLINWLLKNEASKNTILENNFLTVKESLFSILEKDVLQQLQNNIKKITKEINAIKNSNQFMLDNLKNLMAIDLPQQNKTEILNGLSTLIQKADFWASTRKVLLSPFKIFKKEAKTAKANELNQLKIQNQETLVNIVRKEAEKLNTIIQNNKNSLSLSPAIIREKYEKLENNFKIWLKNESENLLKDLPLSQKASLYFVQLTHLTIVLGLLVQTGGIPGTEVVISGALGPVLSKITGSLISKEKLNNFEKKALTFYYNSLNNIILQQSQNYLNYLELPLNKQEELFIKISKIYKNIKMFKIPKPEINNLLKTITLLKNIGQPEIFYNSNFSLLNKKLNELENKIKNLNTHLSIAILGGTGVGKSTFISALAQEEISPQNILRPTSKKATIYQHSNNKLKLLKTDYLIVKHQNQNLKNVSIIDFPDFDSYQLNNEKQVLENLENMDLIFWLTDYHKYADLKFYQFLEKAQHLSPKTQIIILNKSDELLKPDKEMILNDFQEKIKKYFKNKKVYSISSLTALKNKEFLGDFQEIIEILENLKKKQLRENLKKENLTTETQELEKEIIDIFQKINLKEKLEKLENFQLNYSAKELIEPEINFLKNESQYFAEAYLALQKENTWGLLGFFSDLSLFVKSFFKKGKQDLALNFQSPKTSGLLNLIKAKAEDLKQININFQLNSGLETESEKIFFNLFNNILQKIKPPSSFLLYLWPLILTLILVWAETQGKLSSPTLMLAAAIKNIVPWLILSFLGNIFLNRFIWFRAERKARKKYFKLLKVAQIKLEELCNNCLLIPLQSDISNIKNKITWLKQLNNSGAKSLNEKNH